MIRATILLLSIISAVTVGSAQSVVITPEQKVYKRTGADVPEHKKEFEVRYPRFTAGADPKALQKLAAGTDYWKLFEMSLEDNLNDDSWLSGCDYEVRFNERSILDIRLSCDGVGAYPDGSSRYLVFDLRSGEKVTFADLFLQEQLPQLTKAVVAVMKRKESKLDPEARDYLKGNRESYPEFYPVPEKITLDKLAGFSISAKGVTFKYDYSFPHVAKFYEPDGDLFIPYATLRPFIRPDGLLGTFIR